jgi:hypothetical protein
MPSARSNPLDSNRPRPVRQSHAQNPDTPERRLFFLALLRTLLGIAIVHPTLTRETRDHLIGLIRGVIERIEQNRLPAPARAPAQGRQNRASATILASARHQRRPRAEPAPPPPRAAPHCASANQVRGPPRATPTSINAPSFARPPPAAFLPRSPTHRHLAA